MLLVGCWMLMPTFAAAQAQPSEPSVISDVLDARLQMRERWSQHAMWTRAYVVARVSQSPDADAAGERLKKENRNIAVQLTPVVGQPASQELAQVLDQQLSLIANMVRAGTIDAQAVGTSAGEPIPFDRYDAEWRRNGDRLVQMLGGEAAISSTSVADPIRAYMSAVFREFVSRMNKNWQEDVRAADDACASAVRVADALATRAANLSTHGAVGTSGVR